MVSHNIDMVNSSDNENRGSDDAEQGKRIVPPLPGDLRNLILERSSAPAPDHSDWNDQTVQDQPDEPEWVRPDEQPRSADKTPWRGRGQEDSRHDARTAHSEYENCLRCGAVLEDDDNYCPSCGASSTGVEYVRESAVAIPAPQPDAVAQFGPPAGFGRRLVAFFIDLTLVYVILLIIAPLIMNRALIDMDGLNEYVDYVQQVMTDAGSLEAGESIPDVPERAAAAIDNLQLITLMNAIIYSIYQGLMIGLMGTTLGKRLMRVYVLDSDGSVMGLPRSMARAALIFASMLFFYFAFIFVLFRSDRRGLHDLVADTYAVRIVVDKQSVRE